MTPQQVLATTPAWQQVIDRNLFPLALILGLLVVYVSMRRRAGRVSTQSASEIRRNALQVMLAFVAFGVLWLIGAHVAPGKAGYPIDETLANWARSHVSTDRLVTLSWISELGSTLWLTLVTFAIGFWQWRKGRGLIGLAAMLASAANGLAIRGLKADFERIRPEHLHVGPLEPGFSYPSGHSAGSILVYGILAWLLTRDWPARRRWLAFGLAILMAVLIATTRVLLQVHYLSDVVGGLLLGGGILLLAMVWIRSRERQQAARALAAHGVSGDPPLGVDQPVSAAGRSLAAGATLPATAEARTVSTDLSTDVDSTPARPRR